MEMMGIDNHFIELTQALVMEATDTSHALNHKWGRTDSGNRWNKRFKKLWKCDLPLRDKVWIWKLVQQGLPTAERIAKWRRGTGQCARCLREIECMTHLFVTYSAAQRKWNEWGATCLTGLWKMVSDGDLIDLFGSVWMGNQLHKIIFFTKVTWIVWLERNNKTFNQVDQYIPFKVTGSTYQ
ncbi:hypothetical protein R1sor_000780 [Riccia sorocarpa]|uniref:Reverse transcriptase zinc-binding domain-containing protein n=1 Tax=Riccia sorocarpa TaxID=122646 RepID=A0ABD3GU50_9MARC